MDEMDDPEASYRRGYQQGAYAAMTAADSLGMLPKGLERLRQWAGVELWRWRYKDRPDDRSIDPPAPPR